jgi:hypothetical protein
MLETLLTLLVDNVNLAAIADLDITDAINSTWRSRRFNSRKQAPAAYPKPEARDGQLPHR